MATLLGLEYAMPIRRISADDYHRIGEAHVFAEDERVELLDGVLIAMPPIGYRHGYSARTIANLFGRAFGERAVIDTQSIALSADSEPEPDVSVLRPPFDRYRARLPRPDDVLLLVETADSSLRYGLGPKARAYGTAGIREFWVIDVPHAAVHVHRLPHAGGYGDVRTYRRGEHLAAAAFPDVFFAVSDFVEPAEPSR